MNENVQKMQQLLDDVKTKQKQGVLTVHECAEKRTEAFKNSNVRIGALGRILGIATFTFIYFRGPPSINYLKTMKPRNIFNLFLLQFLGSFIGGFFDTRMGDEESYILGQFKQIHLDTLKQQNLNIKE